MYYVYECEISEENMCIEMYEYETITKYTSLTDAEVHFPQKYSLNFSDIHTLKGHRIFNVDFYI